METTVYAVMIWVAAVTGWDMPAYRPDILPLTNEVSARLGGTACASFVPSIGGHGTIFLGSCAKDEDVVHEVVHFFQQERGEEPQTSEEECLFELKAEEIENLWKVAHGRPESRPYYELCGRFIEPTR